MPKLPIRHMIEPREAGATRSDHASSARMPMTKGTILNDGHAFQRRLRADDERTTGTRPALDPGATWSGQPAADAEHSTLVHWVDEKGAVVRLLTTSAPEPVQDGAA